MAPLVSQCGGRALIRDEAGRGEGKKNDFSAAAAKEGRKEGFLF